jgi:hypothetical protein
LRIRRYLLRRVIANDCQRTTGSAFVINLVVAEEDFSIRGDTRSIILPTGSGAGNELHCCERCGTYIWCRYQYHKARVIAVRGGTLEDPDRAPPQARIFVASKQRWLTLPNDMPSFAGAFDRREVWPDESIKRHEKLITGR